MYIRFLLIVLSFCLSGNTMATNDGPFTLYLVRHAEKLQDDSRDPELTEAGKLRADKLAGWLNGKDITDVWSSDYIRTRDTATPFATENKLDLKIYDPRDLDKLAEQLLKNQHNAYVVGHSNTTPKLANILCQCTIADMDESEYDRLILISVNNGETQVKTLNQKNLFQP